jgi:hypothetical protein
MTKKKAKALTLEVWEYLASHPEIEYKSKLPKRLYSQIKDLDSECPLCEIFDQDFFDRCKGCPLKDAGQQCGRSPYKSVYDRWCSPSNFSKTQTESSLRGIRGRAARKIVNIVKEW